MKRKLERQNTSPEDVVFLPAITPIEAAVIPARDVRGYGALHHARAAWRPGESGRTDAFSVRMPKLRAWGPRRPQA
ncbi:MAG: hypothetical protein Q4F18_07220 [Clostridia bacterium]|nr:hypothetical protein [Clostridia bacterium]